MVGTSIGGGDDQPSLVVVGAASRDIVAGDPRGWRLGGGVTYGALAAARLGMHVRALIGVDGDTIGARELELLAAAGVEVQTVRLARGPAMENREAGSGRMQLVAQASDRMPLAALPAAWLGGAAVLLAPVANELAPEWAAAIPRATLVALAWQGVFRRLVAGHAMVHLPLDPNPLVARADIALVSADDAAAGGTPLRRLLRRPGQQLVITHGPRGALHLRRRGRTLVGRLLPAVPAAHVRDTTGAGDVFLAAWCAGLGGHATVAGEDDWRPLAVASTAASLSVEGDGLEGVPSLAQICRRIRRSQAPAPGG